MSQHWAEPNPPPPTDRTLLQDTNLFLWLWTFSLTTVRRNLGTQVFLYNRYVFSLTWRARRNICPSWAAKRWKLDILLQTTAWAWLKAAIINGQNMLRRSSLPVWLLGGKVKLLVHVCGLWIKGLMLYHKNNDQWVKNLLQVHNSHVSQTTFIKKWAGLSHHWWDIWHMTVRGFYTNSVIAFKYVMHLFLLLMCNLFFLIKEKLSCEWKQLNINCIL